MLIQDTASAVPGAKKAEPWTHNDPYLHRPGTLPVVCEMDAMQKSTATPVAAAA
jgi:hypothetical protein